MNYLYNLLVMEKDFFGSLAAIATVFAFFVPLPMFLYSSFIKRRDEARERAFNLITETAYGEARLIRENYLKIVHDRKLESIESFFDLSLTEQNSIRQFMNSQEVISLHLNTSRLDEGIFLRYHKQTFLKDWSLLEPFINMIRQKSGIAELYVEWEMAVKRAKR